MAWGLTGIRRDRRPRIHTLILAGSVLKTGFPWRELMDAGNVGRVINECGTRDWVLAICQLFVLGMAGRVGFVGMMDPERFLNRYYRFGHSGYFESPDGSPQNDFMRERWLPILAGVERPAQIDRREGGWRQGMVIFLLNNSGPLKILFLLAILMTPTLFYLGLFARSQTNLRDALLYQAEALRATTQDHRRHDALAALAQAARIDWWRRARTRSSSRACGVSPAR